MGIHEPRHDTVILTINRFLEMALFELCLDFFSFANLVDISIHPHHN